MKIRKTLALLTMAAALAGTNVFAAFADEEVAVVSDPGAAEPAVADVENQKNGWELEGGKWFYYENGNMVRDRLIKGEDDGRGSLVYYYVDESGVMVTNTTKVINDVEYKFDEEGAFVAAYPGAPKGTTSGQTFKNTYFNMMLAFAGTQYEEEEVEDQYTGVDYATIGSPKKTQDLYIELGDRGELEIYYLDMKNAPTLDAATFAVAFANLEKGKNGLVSAPETVTIGGQNYVKVATSKTKKRTTITTRYCRKQGDFMVVIETTGDSTDEASRAAVVNEITVVQ